VGAEAREPIAGRDRRICRRGAILWQMCGTKCSQVYRKKRLSKFLAGERVVGTARLTGDGVLTTKEEQHASYRKLRNEERTESDRRPGWLGPADPEEDEKV
jgi:hypothetical protein